MRNSVLPSRLTSSSQLGDFAGLSVHSSSRVVRTASLQAASSSGSYLAHRIQERLPARNVEEVQGHKSVNADRQAPFLEFLFCTA
jgi:hypothetical protein